MNKGVSEMSFILFMVIVAFFGSGLLYFVTQEATQYSDAIVDGGALSTSANFSGNNTEQSSSIQDFITNLNTLSSDNELGNFVLVVFGVLVVFAGLLAFRVLTRL